MAGRREHRQRSVVPVRIFGTDINGEEFRVAAHTLDISLSGALLAGVGCDLQVGSEVLVQRGIKKAHFKICWAVTRQGARQYGAQCLEPAKNIWSCEFDAPALEPQAPHRPNPPKETYQSGEQRLSERVTCSIGVEFRVPDAEIPMWGRCSKISETGCYIETRTPLAPDSKLMLRLRSEQVLFVSSGIVKQCDQDAGMGIQFTQTDSTQLNQLRDLLTKLKAFEGEVGIKHASDKKNTDADDLISRLESNRTEVSALGIRGELEPAIQATLHHAEVLLSIATDRSTDSPEQQMDSAMQARLSFATTMLQQLQLELLGNEKAFDQEALQRAAAPLADFIQKLLRNRIASEINAESSGEFRDATRLT